MKNTMIIGLIVGLFAFSGTALAAMSANSSVRTGEAWGFVTGMSDTAVYRLFDKENGVMCYFSYTQTKTGDFSPSTSCVKVK